MSALNQLPRSKKKKKEKKNLKKIISFLSLHEY